MTTIRITDHAIDRYIKFFGDRSAPPARSQVRAMLMRAAATAEKRPEKTRLGDTQWEIRDPHCLLVTKQDDHRSPIVCVTILPVYERAYTERELQTIQGKLDELAARAERLKQAEAMAVAEKRTADAAALKVELQLAMTDAAILKEHARTARFIAAEAAARAKPKPAIDALFAEDLRRALGMTKTTSNAKVIAKVLQLQDELRTLRQDTAAYQALKRVRRAMAMPEEQPVT